MGSHIIHNINKYITSSKKFILVTKMDNKIHKLLIYEKKILDFM